MPLGFDDSIYWEERPLDCIASVPRAGLLAEQGMWFPFVRLDRSELSRCPMALGESIH